MASFKELILLSILSLSGSLLFAQESASPYYLSGQQYAKSNLSHFFISPISVPWKSTEDLKYISNETSIINSIPTGQAILNSNDGLLKLRSDENHLPGLLLDFGKEIHGGIQLITGMMQSKDPVKIRVRFGESIAEAMSEIDTIHGATNDHAMRDFIIDVPWLGRIDVGESGFRYIRIDLVEAEKEIFIKELNARLVIQDIPKLGSFQSDDERLNQIWEVGAYTVHLNMQDYLWDGIKRDRLVWVGDLHPEISTINAVFGYNSVVPRSLDLIRDSTPIPEWMNGISSYSLWWIINHHDWYHAHGNMDYLREQESYLQNLVTHILSKIKNGQESLDGTRFLDWPSNENELAIHAGLQALTLWSLRSATAMFIELGNTELAAQIYSLTSQMETYIPDPNNSKQAAALMVLTGLGDSSELVENIIKKDGVNRFSTFYGFYMLEALASRGEYSSAIDYIKEYWGGMLDLGATTFWEDFDIQWKENASRIDEFPTEGKIDVHQTYGNYSYSQLRNSLCHGWASGPTAWLSRHVLGIEVVEPGGKKVKVSPKLGNLNWVEGSFPTEYGIIKVSHRKNADGTVSSTIDLPDGVELVHELSQLTKE